MPLISFLLRISNLETALLFVAVVAAIVLSSLFSKKRRQEGLARVAQEMGFTYSPEAIGMENLPLRGLPFFARSNRVSNLLQGVVASGRIVLIDCRVVIGRTVYSQTVGCLQLAGKEFPSFELRPESFWLKIGSPFGYQDINFPENDSFSNNFQLGGENEAAVRGVFHSSVRSYFDQHRGWNVEGRGEWLAIYKEAEVVSPPKLRGFIEESQQIARVFS